MVLVTKGIVMMCVDQGDNREMNECKHRIADWLMNSSCEAQQKPR